MNYTSNSVFNKPHKTYDKAVKEFLNYMPTGDYDYWTAQLMWSEYVDGLCKAGKISQKQYDNWSCPFEYGKHVVVGYQKIVKTRKVGNYDYS